MVTMSPLLTASSRKFAARQYRGSPTGTTSKRKLVVSSRCFQALSTPASAPFFTASATENKSACAGSGGERRWKPRVSEPASSAVSTATVTVKENAFGGDRAGKKFFWMSCTWPELIGTR